MVQGTSSHVGKSVLAAAFLRILKRKGVSAAPFKAQNMALNSSVARGGEIGRAQAFQAEAAGVVPTTDMNPVLLKPTGDRVSQVIIQGKVYGTMSAAEYHAFKKEAARYVLESYRRLESRYDAIVVEGAGSPAEINLRENDIANMGVAELIDCPVILAGDIDRGGVFASIVGTMELLAPSERARVKGFIINKFRGDVGLLSPGIEFLEKKTGKPVLGVVPYFKDLMLPDEDGVSIEGISSGKEGRIKIAVIMLPRISNFTDFDPFKISQDVELAFVTSLEALKGADIAVLPGTKNTLSDLLWLREKGLDRALKEHVKNGGVLWGVCGGYQMLGDVIEDPLGLESRLDKVEGLGLIKARTVLMKEKNVFDVKAECIGPDGKTYPIKGYEIHMGVTEHKGEPFSVIKKRGDEAASLPEGCIAHGGLVWGTYVHGVFDNDGLRESFLDTIRKKKGLAIYDKKSSFSEVREKSIEALADMVEENIKIEEVLGIMGLGEAALIK